MLRRILIGKFFVMCRWAPNSDVNGPLVGRQVNVGSAIASWITNLVGEDGTVGLFAKVDQEVLIELHTAVLSVDVDLDKLGTFPVKDN